MQFGWIADKKRGEIWNKVLSSANILSGKMNARESKKDKQCVHIYIWSPPSSWLFSPSFSNNHSFSRHLWTFFSTQLALFSHYPPAKYDLWTPLWQMLHNAPKGVQPDGCEPTIHTVWSEKWHDIKASLISDLKMQIFTCSWWCCINNKLLFKWCY